ncbi:hypothetical protein DSO57_1022631 [Entomophthora muscae]|uniref:Uncharacterized protein n=1 Tax=Entomophthora muscae TaxID=34485 RepID=A0ACC2TR19_9FUNG|nr:hypothetical protein DSO57_1022631 [Entomophthora muscae]
MKTRSIETEVLYSLTPTTKINDAFRLFGIKEYSGPVLLISLETCSQKLSELRSYLESTFGTKSLEFSEESLVRFGNQELIAKAYNLDFTPNVSTEILSQQIVATMTMKWWL